MLSCFHHIVSSHSWHFLCLGHTYVRGGNRFGSQVHDNRVGGSRKKSMLHPYGLLQLTVQPIPPGIGSQMVGMKRDFVLM